MNPNLSRLQAYPFERLRQLFAGVQPNPAFRPISLGIGEPRHAAPDLVKKAYCDAIQHGGGLSVYPATGGDLPLRSSIARSSTSARAPAPRRSSLSWGLSAAIRPCRAMPERAPCRSGCPDLPLKSAQEVSMGG